MRVKKQLARRLKNRYLLITEVPFIDLPVNQVTKKREGIDRASLKKVTQLVGSSVII